MGPTHLRNTAPDVAPRGMTFASKTPVWGRVASWPAPSTELALTQNKYCRQESNFFSFLACTGSQLVMGKGREGSGANEGSFLVSGPLQNGRRDARPWMQQLVHHSDLPAARGQGATVC